MNRNRKTGGDIKKGDVITCSDNHPCLEALRDIDMNNPIRVKDFKPVDRNPQSGEDISLCLYCGEIIIERGAFVRSGVSLMAEGDDYIMVVINTPPYHYQLRLPEGGSHGTGFGTGLEDSPEEMVERFKLTKLEAYSPDLAVERTKVLGLATRGRSDET